MDCSNTQEMWTDEMDNFKHLRQTKDGKLKEYYLRHNATSSGQCRDMSI